jgi:hypothetical protein
MKEGIIMKVTVFLVGLCAAVAWSSPVLAGKIQVASDLSLCVAVDRNFPLDKPVKSSTKLVLQRCAGSVPTQSWTNRKSGAAIEIRANVQDEGSALCIGVPGPVAKSEMVLEVQGCSQTQQQLWAAEIDFKTGLVQFVSYLSSAEKLCMDIRGANMKAGTWLQLYRCNGTKAQKFTLP